MNATRTRVPHIFVMVMSGLLVAGLALPGCSTPQVAVPAILPPAFTTIGPKAYGNLTIGMTFDQAKAAGLVRGNKAPNGPGCEIYDLYIGDTRDGHVHISAGRGVEAIGPELNVSTAEGVTVGTKIAKAKEIYPDLDQAVVKQLGRYNVHVPGNPTAMYRLDFRNNEVESISLQLADQACYE